MFFFRKGCFVCKYFFNCYKETGSSSEDQVSITYFWKCKNLNNIIWCLQGCEASLHSAVHLGKHVEITPRHSLAWIIPAVQSPEVYMKSMYVMYFFSIAIAMYTTDLDIHLALPCCASGSHNKIVHTVRPASRCTSSKPKQSRACIVWSDKEHRVYDPGSMVASIPVLQIKQCVATVTFPPNFHDLV